MSPAGAFAKFPAQVSLPVVPQYFPAFRKTIFTYLSRSVLVGMIKDKNKCGNFKISKIFELISAMPLKFGRYYRIITLNFDVRE